MPRLGELLRDGGWDAKDISTAASVIGAESGFRADVKNTRASCGIRDDGTPAYAIGLMQICTIHLNKGGLAEGLTEEDLKNPLTNVRVGKKIFDAQGWRAWEVTHTGAHKRFPNAANRNIETGKGRGVIGTIGDIATAPLDAAGAIADAALGPLGTAADIATAPLDIAAAISGSVDKLADPSTWFRAGKVWFGGIIIVIGVGALTFVVARKAANSDVAKAIPQTRALKAIK